MSSGMVATVKWVAAADALPDDEMEVLLVLADGEVWMGYADGGEWRLTSADKVEGVVMFWADLPEPPC